MRDDQSQPTDTASVLRPSQRRYFADLLLVAIATSVTALVIWDGNISQTLHWILATPFLIFYPGYVVIAAVFPEAPPVVESETVQPDGPPSRLARLGLALLVSPIVVAVVALLLSPFAAIALVPLLVGITCVTLLGVGAAGLRRLQLAPHLRDGLLIGSASNWRVFRFQSRQSAATAVAILLLLGTVITAVAVPPDSEPYTEAYLLTESDDEYLADDFPTELSTGETATVHLGLENHENERMSYTGVTVVQSEDGDDPREVDSFDISLGDGEQHILSQSFTADDPDTDTLQVLIYEDSPPADPTAENASYVLQLQLSIEG